MTSPLITLCMIVKDEAAHIADCLRSVQPAVDACIVVDTGSRDRTPEICRGMGAKVLDFQWTDSFADARNWGIQAARSEWILWLDADERLEPAEARLLRTLVKDSTADALNLKVINYTGVSMGQSDVTQAYQWTQTRLFRNGKGVRFSGRVHEQPVWPEESMPQLPIPVLPVQLHHYGYLEEETDRKNKLQRNLRLLELQLENRQRLLAKGEEPDPSEYWCEYHLASEWYRAKDYEQAFHMVNECIKGFVSASILPPALVYKLKYDIMLRHGSIQGAWPGIDLALLLYPDYVDLHFYKGRALFEWELWDQAEEAFAQCLRLGEDQGKYLSLNGMGSFRAAEFHEQCLQKLGRMQAEPDK